MKGKYKLGSKTKPSETPKLTGVEEVIAPLTYVNMERSERKLNIIKQCEGRSLNEENLESSDMPYTIKYFRYVKSHHTSPPIDLKN